jgi:hypothetical protein
MGRLNKGANKMSLSAKQKRTLSKVGGAGPNPYTQKESREMAYAAGEPPSFKGRHLKKAVLKWAGENKAKLHGRNEKAIVQFLASKLEADAFGQRFSVL